MTKRFIYTKLALKSFRFIALFCVLLLSITIVDGFLIGGLSGLAKGESVDIYAIVVTFINIISLIFFFIVFLFPQKFGLIAIISYLYASLIIIFEPDNYMGLLMFFLGTEILFVRGLMEKHKKMKILIIGIFLLCLLLSYFRFGLKNFFNYFLYNFGGILILLLLVFTIYAYYSNTIICKDKKLYLESYPELNKRDFEILKKIQQGEKYTAIARELHITSGTLKNRLHYIFTILETGDKQGFLSCYRDWELCYFEEKNQEVGDEEIVYN